jgi:hypothetical protein
MAASSVLQSVVTTIGLEDNPIVLASLRLTFGGSPCPSIFSKFSETTTNLANEIMRCPDWQPATLRSRYAKYLVKPTIPSLESTPSRQLALC